MVPRISLECPECNEVWNVAGPLWCGEIQNHDFIETMMDLAPTLHLNTENKVLRLLEKCKGESNAPATFYDLHTVCRKLKVSAPRMDKIISMLEDEGYLVSKTHYNPNGIKTEAPLDLIEKIILKGN